MWTSNLVVFFKVLVYQFFQCRQTVWLGALQGVFQRLITSADNRFATGNPAGRNAELIYAHAHQKRDVFGNGRHFTTYCHGDARLFGSGYGEGYHG